MVIVHFGSMAMVIASIKRLWYYSESEMRCIEEY